MKICNTCAWYCHGDGQCWRPDLRKTVAIATPNYSACHGWTFDGLEDWEREACEPDALVTMELETA